MVRSNSEEPVSSMVMLCLGASRRALEAGLRGVSGKRGPKVLISVDNFLHNVDKSETSDTERVWRGWRRHR